MTPSLPVDIKRGMRLAIALTSIGFALGACNHSAESVTASIPDDYRLRHPIAIQERDRSTTIFVGNARAGLSASQRADVIAMSQSWLREGTGAIIADVPVGTPNARAAADTFREIQSLLISAGVPPRGVVKRNYHPDSVRTFAAIQLNYPRIAAVAGPCGTWPDDIGPSIRNKGYLANKPYFNLGCSQQRNLAAIVANPSDLVQPRPEGPAYNARRTYALDKYRQGQSPQTTYPDADKQKISNVGQ